jgi:hypothetical protein
VASNEDYGKYCCAMGSRSVRRVAAKVYAAAELDGEVRDAMLRELTEALTWHQMAVPSPRPTHHLTEDEDGEVGRVVIDLAVYADGRPVFTVVDWLDGYSTIVRHPDGLPEGATSELAEERCPCCGGMPRTASGPDDDGGADAPNAK